MKDDSINEILEPLLENMRQADLAAREQLISIACEMLACRITNAKPIVGMFTEIGLVHAASRMPDSETGQFVADLIIDPQSRKLSKQAEKMELLKESISKLKGGELYELIKDLKSGKSVNSIQKRLLGRMRNTTDRYAEVMLSLNHKKNSIPVTTRYEEA